MTRVKTVDIFTCREILRIRSGVEQYMAPDGFGEYYWAELLRDCSESDALEATWAHYRTKTRPLTPADILAQVGAEVATRVSMVARITDQLLCERTRFGWTAEQLARWNITFDTEIGRGADIEDARDCADLDAHDEDDSDDTRVARVAPPAALLLRITGPAIPVRATHPAAPTDRTRLPS
ncbi:hypothetical protein [Rhodococcus sp. HNM0563]|uniref:hypothetical protein n=1 Tax=Rhodococcus sp. HNM0563 TaxID=2716339 RepID=UPI0019826056|nr:hypothetical protein [Rhodococcus sp. HNM0563]